MKKLLLLTAVAFAFASCNKCVECNVVAWEGGATIQHQIYDGDSYEEFGDMIVEICSDNFESKKDFKDYTAWLEDNGAECESDFWN
mgnify:CR=1 FL=1|tara:strand:- start:205 stop:462 length:258 start_codon:yes stop_codon:yes gene_type:complete